MSVSFDSHLRTWSASSNEGAEGVDTSMVSMEQQHPRPDLVAACAASSIRTNTSNATTTTTEPKNLRKAIRATRAQPQDVESCEAEAAASNNTIAPRHVLRIFRCNKEDFSEISPEQVDRVKKMHERIDEGVNFSFNYNVLLLVSSVLAGLGLVSDNGTTIIASMLVSPLMGPVVGLAYGTTIQDWKLVRRSFRNECLSLVFCVLTGLAIGCCTGPTALSDEWPTSEMASRASVQNFLVALPVAFFSGLGVAVSLLDDQTASLVGVAISASLLPPAVNAGIIWIAHAFSNEGIIIAPTATDTEEIDRDDYRNMGLMSLSVTLSNIFLIWLSSMLMFRMKEVLPIKKKVFWEDLGVARKIYQDRALLKSYDAANSVVADNDNDENAAAAAVAPASEEGDDETTAM